MKQKEISAKTLAAKLFILSDLSQHHTTTEIAEHVGMNEFDLKREFKKRYKKGLFELLTDERMKQAKKQLKAGIAIKMIASQLGFTVSGFNHTFKKAFNKTPTEYRKKK